MHSKVVFISIIKVFSSSQLLDIRTPDDVNHQSAESMFYSHCDHPAKSLKISGIEQDNGEEDLTSMVFQILCNTNIYCLEITDTINRINLALKKPVESLQVFIKSTEDNMLIGRNLRSQRSLSLGSFPKYQGLIRSSAVLLFSQ